MLLSSYNGGNVQWYHLSPQGWYAKCPTLEVVLVFENLKALGKTPGVLDAMRVSGFDFDAVSLQDLPQVIKWYGSEVLSGLPLTYDSWLAYVYEASGQQLSASNVEDWGKRPLRELVSHYQLVRDRKKAEFAK
jgi:hypothetical protein